MVREYDVFKNGLNEIKKRFDFPHSSKIYMYIYLVCFFSNTEVDNCLQDGTCKNGGTCVSDEMSFSCLCRAGWTGVYCEKGKISFSYTG